MKVVNLAQKFSLFQDHFSPKVVGELNDSHILLGKVKGEFLWHHHENEDELLLVVKGKLTMQLRTGDVDIHPGEFFIVPRGVEHCPKAEEEVHIVMIEPKTTLNTGNIKNERTVPGLQRL